MSDIRIPRGNTFYTRVTVVAVDAATRTPISGFSLNDCTDLHVYYIRRNKQTEITNYTILDGNRLRIKWLGTDMKIGGYGLEATGIYNALEWRFYNTDRYVFTIVESNEEANIPPSAFIETDYYAINAEVSIISSLGGAQADWSQTDPSEPDYIKNKPTIPTALSELTDDSTHRLVTDAEKSAWDSKGTYNKPSGGIPPSDLSSEVQASLSSADTALQEESDPVFSASAAASITDSDITNWNGKTSNIGTITSVKMNGSTISTSGEADLGAVVTDVSGKQDVINASHKLSADYVTDATATNKFVTSSEKSTWNGKYSKPSTGIPATDLASGVIPDVSNFITKSVNDLVNYYTKSQTYTQSEVNSLIAGISGFEYEVVSTLPTASASTMHKIYLTPSSDPQTQNVKDEYITIDSSGTYSWELIGNTTIDTDSFFVYDIDASGLVNGYKEITSSEPYNAIHAAYQSGKVVYVKWTTDSGMTNIIIPLNSINSYAPYSFVLSLIAPPSHTFFFEVDFFVGRVSIQYASNAIYSKPSTGIPATDLASAVQTSLGKADTSIQSVKVNGTALTPDANKAVDVSVPINLHVEFDDSENGYSANYTYAQIKAAIDSGGYVDLMYDGYIYTYDGMVDVTIYFLRVDSTVVGYASANICGHYISVNNGDSWGTLDTPMLANDVPPVVNALNSASTTAALSANQGKVLNELINTISLGVDNTDKLMYIYVNGEKQGTGIDVAEVVGMPRTITYTLGINMQSSNTATETTQGQSYTSIISSTNPDYLVDTIAVTMGGVDVSSSVVSGNTIYIPKVKGDLTITVTAQFFASVDIDNAYLEIKTGQTGTLKVKLHAQPANNQSVEVNGTNLTVSPSTLTFTPSNWNTWQDVTITTGSVDDTEYGYVVITNSDPLMTETTATVEIQPMGYEDYVDTTIPTEGRHTVTAADFDTTSNYGNYIRLTGYNAEYDNIYIPDTIDGKTPWCTCSGSTGAFYGNTTIKYVTFADGVIYRGGGVTSGCKADRLFEGCTSLIGVSNMNPATTDISSAFKGCSSFKFVDNLDKLINVTNIKAFENSGVEYIQDISGFTSMTVAQEIFKNAASLKKIFGFPKEMATTNVNGTNMYNNCTLLEAAIVPEGVSNLSWAFGNCTSLRKVEIYEDGLTTSGVSSSSTFYNCTNLTVYCNANTTTYDTLVSLFGSSTRITIKTFGGDAKPSIVVWGDSISSPNKAWIEWPARLQTKLGTSQYLVKNEALAGEWSTSTTARQGGYVMTTNAFTIPATTTPVLVTITVNGNETFSANPLFSCGMSYNPCTIDGVDGILSREGAEYFFTRKEAGTAVSVSAGTVIVSDNDTVFNSANNVMLFYLNGNAGWDNNPSKLLDMCQKAVNHFTALGGTKYIVAGLSNLFASTSVSLAEQFEALAAEAFGSHFLSLRTYEIQNGLTQNNLTASTLDVERMTEGRVPASLVGGGSDTNILMYDGVNVTDQVHPNAYGANTIMLAFYDKGVELGYWSSQP